MAKGTITKRSVDAMKASATDQFLWSTDKPGFGVKITPAGKRVYILQYRMGGRGSPTKRYTIGAHGVWTPDLADKEAGRLLRLIDSGTDPAAEKGERQRVATDLAFPAYAARFLELEVKHKWKASYS